MEAVRSEDVADKGREGAFLIACAGIRNRAVVSSKASLARTATGQSRDISRCANARMPQSRVQLLSKTSRFCSMLNRQIPGVETTLSSRKQRTANCSNRQKITFCKSEIPNSVFVTPSPELLSRSLAHHMFLALLGSEFAPLPTPLTTGHSPLVTVISNRELLVLETPQRADNKHRPTVLIENFGPNESRGFRAFVAAAFRRAAFACESSIQAGESAKPEGRTK